jgi:molybdenum cofactor biosynthesis enzyme
VALLAVNDMVKAVDRGRRIEGILLETDGGRSGRWSSE